MKVLKTYQFNDREIQFNTREQMALGVKHQFVITPHQLLSLHKHAVTVGEYEMSRELWDILQAA